MNEHQTDQADTPQPELSPLETETRPEDPAKLESQPRLAHVPELNGLRGLLAVWVMVSHIACWCGWHGRSPVNRLLNQWRDLLNAKGAVETFIILSGFVIAFLFYQKQPSYAGFMKGRFFRIFPVYLFCLICGVATIPVTAWLLNLLPWRTTEYFPELLRLSLQETSHFWPHFLAHLTLLNGMIPRSLLPYSASAILPPAWSISLEWQFYLLAPLLFASLRRPALLIGVGAIAWLGLRFSAIWGNAPLIAFLPPQLPLFLIGIGSYHIYAFLGNRPGMKANAGLVAAVLGVASLVYYPSMALAIWSISFGCIFDAGQGYFGGFLRLIRSILNHRVSVWLGKISYPLYLVHWPMIIILLSVLIRLFPQISMNRATVVMIVGGVPIILSVAVLIHRFIEAPGMQLGKRKRVSPSRVEALTSL